MDRSRFSLLLLEPGEIYFEDFSVKLESKDKINKDAGRLKLCSKSLVFEPQDVMEPLLKILLQHCGSIESMNGLLAIQCSVHAEMLKGNVIAPYTFRHEPKTFLFSLNYIHVDDCLSQIQQLQRASTLPLPDHNSMVAAIAFSRKSRLKFDPNWLQDIYETVLLELDASKVSPLVVNPGRTVLTSSTLYFQPFNNAESYPVMKIKLSNITLVTRRRFLQRQVGLELFCDDTSIQHLYLVFKSVSERQQFYDALLLQPELQLKQLEPEMMTLKWQNHAITNYEYLLYVNSLADRSFNDLTQYPVFPWIINDYKSNAIDISDPKVFRDLSKPIGVLNSHRLERLKQRRDEMVEPRFLYGSHYSAPGFVLFYLIRKYPQYMLCLQNGRFDHPDRIFHNIADVWRNVQENMADFKELIPEFYDTTAAGDFLLHSSDVQLGMRHDGSRIRDVHLPPWSKSASDFVRILREALESDIVSRSLPSWIDLIFGWKQRGKPAEEFDNVFYHLCYEGAIDLDLVTDWSERHALEVQIMEFGQIPKQVFLVPHPPRLKLEPARPLTEKGSCQRLSLLKAIEMGRHKDAVTTVTSCGDLIVSGGRDSILKEFRGSTMQSVRSVSLDTAGISACVLLPDADTLVLGTFDNRILVYKLECSTTMDEVRAHEDAISCLCWNSKTGTLLSGSWDGSMRVWRNALSNGGWGRLKSTPTTRFDRESKITSGALDSEGDLAVCGTEEGEVTLFRISTAMIEFELHLHTTTVTALSIVGSRLITCSREGFNVHDLPYGLHVYSGCQNLHISCMAWFEHWMFLGTMCGSIQCWDFQQVVLIETIKATNQPLSCLNVSTCGKYIISGEGKSIVLRR